MRCEFCFYDNPEHVEVCRNCGKLLKNEDENCEMQKISEKDFSDLKKVLEDAEEETSYIASPTRHNHRKYSLRSVLLAMFLAITMLLMFDRMCRSGENQNLNAQIFKLLETAHFANGGENDSDLGEDDIYCEDESDEYDEGYYDLEDEFEQEEYVEDEYSEDVENTLEEDSWNEEAYFILPESGSRKLKKADVENLSLEDLRLARNEIYARHGYIFESEDLNEYFLSQAWYTPMVYGSEFDEAVLNKYEKYNARYIKKYE